MVKSSQLKNCKLLAFSLFFCLLAGIPALPGQAQSGDSLPPVKLSGEEELIRGERLFYGLIYLGDKSVNCASCHNTQFSDTLNWNPSAFEVSLKYSGKSVDDLYDALLRPSGEKMSQVHEGFQLTSDDIRMLKLYMDHLSLAGPAKSKPVVTNLILFIVAVLLFLFSVADLIIIKKLRYRWIHYPILLSTFSFIVFRLATDAVEIGHSPNYEPDQPVKFSHRVHAGQNATDCMYCHFSAPISKSAGIPPESVCMNCHLLVREGTRSGKFEIAKLLTSFESMEPIAWVRVYNLPDHVFFSHAQHVGAGNIKCQHCHGPVETMDRIRLNSELTMGWCINCHRTTDVNFNGNKFYTEYRELYDKVKKGGMSNVTVENIGGTECMKCHY